MISIYPACFYENKDGSYTVIFPDLDYTATQGENLEDAFAMAVDCLAGYLYTSLENHESFPKASVMSSIDPKKVLQEIDCDDDKRLWNHENDSQSFYRGNLLNRFYEFPYFQDFIK